MMDPGATNCALIDRTSHPTVQGGCVEWWSDLPSELDDHRGYAPSPASQGSWLYRVATFRKGLMAVMPEEEVDHVTSIVARFRHAGHQVRTEWRSPLTFAIAAPIFSLN